MVSSNSALVGCAECRAGVAMTAQRSRAALHPYQIEAIEFLKTDPARQIIAIMGAGKTAIALHAIADLKRADRLADGMILVVAPLLIAESVWHAEAALWQATACLTVERILGTPPQRLAAVNRRADIHVINYDNLRWLFAEIVQRELHFSILIADEASALKNSSSQRSRLMLELSHRAARRWTLTGTPRSYQLTDVWTPAQFVTQGQTFPPFQLWRDANFFPADLYQRIWYPRMGVEAVTIDTLRPFTHVVDQAALNTRPPVVEIVHDIQLDPHSAAVYQQLDRGGVTKELAAKVAAKVCPNSELAIVTKLMQVCSGAVYNDSGSWQRLHDRRLDMLADIHEGHSSPTLVFVTFRHEIERIQQHFPFARELTPGLIDPWNAGEVEMLLAHPASAGHGVNLQYGSDTIVWFSLPWSAELFAQANARLARQGQSGTVTVHVMLSAGRIDDIAHGVVQQRLVDQDRLVDALRVPA
jgi:SNF2 family DNA or RNA helicase